MTQTTASQSITIALSKGRILKETLPLLEQANIIPAEDIFSSRKLIFDTNHPHIKLLVIRATDVPTYVEYGAADMGVSGKDVLLEHGARGLYEPLDLNISRCRLMTAGLVDAKPIPDGGRVKVASKFVNITKRYFASQGKQVDIIKLYGAMELAPIMGLADCIVDIVDTGNTLKANGMQPLELIAPISTRLVVGKAAMKMKHSLIQPIIEQLGEAVERAKTAENLADEVSA
ncbi:ATP phosphoribosyltransferase [Motiliproteus coralliicola]|uniref:ATP phosphoribosyltransferase n=1 Tax=Motiliproteus coralliicola TaxID=2283196 RepID=A0A369WPR2_9GAMM|nr:ATP phosphoribosyltransferase [Motiliproteus coralliicola]RDE23049.1 ATP phosphoribosyltransferase [Motiliproteus coralliicola]